jgi:hypothetical protein
MVKAAAVIPAVLIKLLRDIADGGVDFFRGMVMS